MPILDVEIVGHPEEHDSGLAARLAEAAGEVLDSPPGGTWVRLHHLPPGRYAESGGGPHPGVRPVFVSVTCAVVPCGEDLARRVRALTEAVARECDRPPANVHVFHEPPARGRVAFGGKLVGG